MSDPQSKPRRRRQVKYSWNPDMIRSLREHMDLTQRELADLLEVRQQTISEWETGLHTPHRSTQKTLTMVAERAGFSYEAIASESQSSSNGTGDETRNDTSA
jgi:putative transcriptional regulator